MEVTVKNKNYVNIEHDIPVIYNTYLSQSYTSVRFYT